MAIGVQFRISPPEAIRHWTLNTNKALTTLYATKDSLRVDAYVQAFLHSQ